MRSGNSTKKLINVAFADPMLRKSKVEQARNDNIGFFSITAPSHIKGDNVICGNGAKFAYNTVVTSDAVISEHFHCNIFSYVANDCTVGVL